MNSFAMGFAVAHSPTSASTGDYHYGIPANAIPSSRGNKGNLIQPHVSYLSPSYDHPQSAERLFFHPLGHEVVDFPYWERPWFSFKFSNVRFDDHPPLARNHGQAWVVSNMTAKTDHDATP